MGKAESLHPVVQAEVVLELRVDKVGDFKGAVGQTVAGMVNRGERIRLQRQSRAHTGNAGRLHEERQVRQTLNLKLEVIGIQRVLRLLNQRRFVILW